MSGDKDREFEAPKNIWKLIRV
ncbi:rCG36924, partial [Rattus norvegicus]